jgi:hypothetical protein
MARNAVSPVLRPIDILTANLLLGLTVNVTYVAELVHFKIVPMQSDVNCACERANH